MKTVLPYAIVETGGKQYKVTPGQKLDVDRMAVAEGEKVELSKVLFIADAKDTIIGSPIIDGAKVTATCLGEHKGDKIIVFRYKSKVRYRKKTGHRQIYAKLEIKDILKPGGEAAIVTPKKVVTPKEVEATTKVGAPKKTKEKAAAAKKTRKVVTPKKSGMKSGEVRANGT